jgi:hypothetical protein
VNKYSVNKTKFITLDAWNCESLSGYNYKFYCGEVLSTFSWLCLMQRFLHTVEKSGLFEPYDQRFDETRQTPLNKTPNKGGKEEQIKRIQVRATRAKPKHGHKWAKAQNYVPKPH